MLGWAAHRQGWYTSALVHSAVSAAGRAHTLPQYMDRAAHACLLAGVVLLGRLDGKLEIWDLLDRTHVPVVVASVSPAALMALAFSPGPAGAASRSSHHHVSCYCWGPRFGGA